MNQISWKSWFFFSDFIVCSGQTQDFIYSRPIYHWTRVHPGLNVVLIMFQKSVYQRILCLRIYPLCLRHLILAKRLRNNSEYLRFLSKYMFFGSKYIKSSQSVWILVPLPFPILLIIWSFLSFLLRLSILVSWFLASPQDWPLKFPVKSVKLFSFMSAVTSLRAVYFQDLISFLVVGSIGV